MRTWVDASTLIALDAIGEILVLRDLLGRVAITPQVAEEVFVGRDSRALGEARGSWIEVVSLPGDRTRFTALGLGAGEASLLLAPRGDRLVLDEVPARTVAEAEGRDYVGLLGLLIAGVDRGVLPGARAREILGKLARSAFRMSTDLYDEVLRALAERDPSARA
jgi:predicted nucleic acid-binding protein